MRSLRRESSSITVLLRTGVLVLAVLLAMASGGTTTRLEAGNRAASFSYPHGVAAAGDSLSTGYASEESPGNPAADHPANSWSIGTNPAVASHYARLVQGSAAIAGHTLMVAHDGARVTDLPRQLGQIAGRSDIDYVTIQIGVNDICDARSPSEITPAPAFREAFSRALEVLHEGAPDARVLVTSLADEARWNDVVVLQGPDLAKQVEDGTACDPKPGPDNLQDPSVRALIHRYEQSYNRILSSVCAAFLHCRYDRGALYRLTYRPADVSRHDSFHPSIAGLRRMAAATWKASFDFTDREPPQAKAAVRRTSSYSIVTLGASDNAGVRGIEYSLNGGSYTTYQGPLRLSHGARLAFRAVDVNGNVSAAQFLSG